MASTWSSSVELSKLSEKLLQLARIEAGFVRSDREADLLPVLTTVVTDINASSVWRGRVRVENAAAGLLAPIDPDAFAIPLRNLIENGLKHGAMDRPVHVVIRDKKNVLVRNEGALVSDADLGRLGQPFVRGDTSADGPGLGISIARGILEQAGGASMLNSPSSGATDGFEAVMLLPPSPSADAG